MITEDTSLSNKAFALGEDSVKECETLRPDIDDQEVLDSVKTTLGDYIVAKRMEQNLSGRELARKAGINFATLSAIENNRTENPGFATVVAVFDALKIHPMVAVNIVKGKNPEEWEEPKRSIPVDEVKALITDIRDEIKDILKSRRESSDS